MYCGKPCQSPESSNGFALDKSYMSYYPFTNVGLQKITILSSNISIYLHSQVNVEIILAKFKHSHIAQKWISIQSFGCRSYASWVSTWSSGSSSLLSGLLIKSQKLEDIRVRTLWALRQVFSNSIFGTSLNACGKLYLYIKLLLLQHNWGSAKPTVYFING